MGQASYTKFNLQPGQEINSSTFEEICHVIYDSCKSPMSTQEVQKCLKSIAKATGVKHDEDFVKNRIQELDKENLEMINLEAFRTLFFETCQKEKIFLSRSLQLKRNPPTRPTLRKIEVLLSVYDLWDLTLLNNCTIHIGFGAFHCGLVIWDREYSYCSSTPHSSGGIYDTEPKEETIGRFRRQYNMGFINLTRNDCLNVIAELSTQFQGKDYDIFTHNCNHFCDALCLKLLNRPIPKSLNKLSEFVTNFKGFFGENFFQQKIEQEKVDAIMKFINSTESTNPEEPELENSIDPIIREKMKGVKHNNTLFDSLILEEIESTDSALPEDPPKSRRSKSEGDKKSPVLEGNNNVCKSRSRSQKTSKETISLEPPPKAILSNSLPILDVSALDITEHPNLEKSKRRPKRKTISGEDFPLPKKNFNSGNILDSSQKSPQISPRGGSPKPEIISEDLEKVSPHWSPHRSPRKSSIKGKSELKNFLFSSLDTKRPNLDGSESFTERKSVSLPVTPEDSPDKPRNMLVKVTDPTPKKSPPNKRNPIKILDTPNRPIPNTEHKRKRTSDLGYRKRSSSLGVPTGPIRRSRKSVPDANSVILSPNRTNLIATLIEDDELDIESEQKSLEKSYKALSPKKENNFKKEEIQRENPEFPKNSELPTKLFENSDPLRNIRIEEEKDSYSKRSLKRSNSENPDFGNIQQSKKVISEDTTFGKNRKPKKGKSKSVNEESKKKLQPPSSTKPPHHTNRFPQASSESRRKKTRKLDSRTNLERSTTQPNLPKLSGSKNRTQKSLEFPPRDSKKKLVARSQPLEVLNKEISVSDTKKEKLTYTKSVPIYAKRDRASRTKSGRQTDRK